MPPGPAPPTAAGSSAAGPPAGGPAPEPPPRWAVRVLDRLGRRWWLMTAALLPLAAGVVGCGLSVAGMAELVSAGLPPVHLLYAEVPRAALFCLCPGAAAAAVVVVTAPAWSARPFAVLCVAAAAYSALGSGAQDLAMARDGRGTGPHGAAEVWAAPAVLGLLAFVLWLEHRHGRHSVREDGDGPPLRVWTPDD